MPARDSFAATAVERISGVGIPIGSALIATLRSAMSPEDLTPTVMLALSGQVALLLGGIFVLSKLYFSKNGRAARKRPSPLTPLPWTIIEFGIAVFVVIAGAVGGQIIAQLVVGAMSLSEEQNLTVLGAGFQGGMLVGALLAQFAVAHSRPPIAIDEPAAEDPPAVLADAPQNPLHAPWIAGPVTLLAAMPVLTAANLVWVFILEHFGLNTDKQPMVGIFSSSQSPMVIIGMTLLAVVVAPLTEELIFRAGLFRYIRTRIPRPAAIVLPALLFGSLHSNLVAFVPLVLLGVVFALAYERTGRISVPIVAHALFNLNTILLLLAGVEF